MSGIDELRKSLKKDIDHFDTESKKHKRLHRRCQTSVIVLTSVTTVVAGAGLILPETSSQSLQFAILCLTALTSAVSGWAGMRRAQELWQHEREVFYALVDIHRGLEFNAANRELTPEELEEIFEKISLVLSSSSQRWVGIVRQNNNKQDSNSRVTIG